MMPYLYGMLVTKQWNETLQAHSFMEKKTRLVLKCHIYVLCQISVNFNQKESFLKLLNGSHLGRTSGKGKSQSCRPQWLPVSLRLTSPETKNSFLHLGHLLLGSLINDTK